MGKMNTNITPAEFANNWQSGSTNAVQKTIAGVNRVTESPTEKAADAVDRQVAGVQRAAQSGKTEAALRKVTLQEWKSKTAQKVGERMAGGVAAAKGKMQQFGEYLIPTLNSGMSTVNAMPATTFQERMQKMVAMATYMHENPYKR